MGRGPPTPQAEVPTPAGPPFSSSILSTATIASYGTPSPKSKIGGVQNWTPDQIPWKELELPERVLPVRDTHGFATFLRVFPSRKIRPQTKARGRALP